MKKHPLPWRVEISNSPYIVAIVDKKGYTITDFYNGGGEASKETEDLAKLIVTAVNNYKG